MRQISYRQALYEAIAEEMVRDKKVILLGEDIAIYGGAFGVTADLWKRFGKERVINTPISENSFVGVGIGLAISGMRPVVEIMFMDFIALAADQIINHAAKLHYIYGGQLNVPMVIRTPAGAGRGYGATHSQSLERIFMGIPGLRIVAPYTAYDAKGLLKAAIRDNNPTLFIEHKLLYGRLDAVPQKEYVLPLDKVKVIKEGKDITLISYSKMLDLCLAASEVLSNNGIDVEIINLISLKPIEIETISSSIKKTGRFIFVEEGSRQGGIGSEVCTQICECCLEYLNGPVIRVAAEDVPIPSSKELESEILPNTKKIIEAVRRSLNWS